MPHPKLELLRESFAEAKKKGGRKPLIITNCKVFDVETCSLQFGGALMAVVVDHSTGKIERVDSAVSLAAGPPLPRDAIRIDAKGATVMPGLCDAHVHVTACTANLSALLSVPESLVAIRAEKVLEGMMLRGFTTIRDAGGADFGLADAVEEGSILGPRLLFTGHALSQTGGHGDMRGKGEDFCACGSALRGIGRVCDGVPECRKAARDELRKGAHCIKVMASGGVASPTDRLTNTQFSLEELMAIVDEAEAAGAYVCAHAYTAKAILRALKCGVRSIEHGNFLDDECAAYMAENGCFLVPTIITYEALRSRGVEAGMAPELVAKVGSLVELGLESLRVAKRHGVKTVYGSDLLGELHALQSQELRLRAGVLGAVEVLKQATVNAAELFNLQGEIGKVAPGYRADLLIVDFDPVAQLEHLWEHRGIKAVIKEGILAATDGDLVPLSFTQ